MDVSKDIATEATGRNLLYLPAGIATKPKWLFAKFNPASLAKHGLRKSARKSSREPNSYVIQLADNDLVLKITADTPIMYLGFKKWAVVDDG